MKKNALAITLASVVGTFAAGATLAQNGPPGPPNPGPWVNPSLFNSERSGICLIESSLSIVAANVAHYGCSGATGNYFLDVAVDGNGVGTAALDGVTLNGVVAPIPPITGKGQNCTITQVGSGKLFTPARGGGVKVQGYKGQHVWNFTNTIFIDQAPPFKLAGVWYNEHSIKHFYRPRKNPKNWTTLDYGLEVITKLNYPREKWWQQSWYTSEDGTPAGGTVVVKKTRQAPAVACQIGVYLDGYNVANEFYYTGTITVR